MPLAAAQSPSPLSAVRRFVGMWLRCPLPFVLAFALTLLATFGLWQFNRVEDHRATVAARLEIGRVLDDLRSRIEKSLAAPVLSTRGIVAEVAAHGDITADAFERAVRVMTSGYPSVRNLTLSRGTVIAMVAPPGPDQRIIGTDYRTQPHQWAQIKRSIDSRQTLLQGPVELIQGGVAMVVRTPIYLPDVAAADARFFGMVSAVINIPVVFAEAGVDDPDLPIEVAIRGRDGMGEPGEVFHGDAALFDQRPVVTDVALPYGSWRMAAIPKGGWRSASRVDRQITRMLSGLLLLLLAIAAFGTAHHVASGSEANRRLRDSEKALRRKSAELQRSNTDLQQFAYVVSHDLREPLRMVGSYVTLLERRLEGQLDAEAREFIGFAREGAQRMDHMVADLLELSRVGRGEEPPRPVALGEILAMVKGSLAFAIADAGAHVVGGDQLPLVLGWPNELERLLQNLIGNALKYHAADQAPLITVTAEPATGEDGKGMWTIVVADNGIGIDSAHFERIFAVFQRLHTREKYEGTGIGLSICRKIVERHGGRIWVESTPGKGAVFKFTLPAAAPVAA